MVDGATESEKFVLQKSPGFAVHPRPGLAKFEHVRGVSRAQLRFFLTFFFTDAFAKVGAHSKSV